MNIYYASPRRLGVALAALAAALAGAVTAGAQPAAPPGGSPGATWRFTAPDAAAAWFHTLGEAHLGGPGAFAFYRSSGTPESPLARTLAASSRYEILHFAPLYFPSAARQDLVRAVRNAASASPTAGAPRAAFLEGALTSTLATTAQRAPLAELADAVERSQPTVIPAASLDRWQHAWNARFAAPLAPFLQAERLDQGVVMVAGALGPEGRLFAGQPADRADNIAAVGTLDAAPDADAPVFAFVRELCFPLVSRAADQAPSLKASRAEAARRTSIAAVRCGGELLDLFIPAEAGGYRAHWLRVADISGRSTFDTLFPPDPILAPRIRTALGRFAPRP